MRVLLDVKSPIDPFNTMVRNGTAGPTLRRILDDLKPEAVYFTERDGCRAGTLIIDLDRPSDIPTFAEPFFLNFNAECRFHPVMTPEDLAAAGLDDLGEKWG